MRLDELARSLATQSGRHDAGFDAFARTMGRPIRRRAALKLMGSVVLAGAMTRPARAGTYCPGNFNDCGPVINGELRGECCDPSIHSCCTGGPPDAAFVSCCVTAYEICDPSIHGCRCKDELLCDGANCCKPPNQCLGVGCCCAPDEDCVDGGCVPRCSSNQSPCERECCETGQECVSVPGSSKKRCLPRCRAGTKRCGGACCHSDETCCLARDEATCCPKSSFLVCGQQTIERSRIATCDDRCRLAGKGEHCRHTCCDKGEECCGGKTCCELGSCVSGECKCPRGQRLCKGPRGERCCKRSERCCSGEACCKRSESCCGEKCCKKGEHCSSFGNRSRRQTICCKDKHQSCQRTPGAKPVCCPPGESCAKLLRGGTDVGANAERVCCPPERLVPLRSDKACCPAGTVSLGQALGIGPGVSGSCCPEDQVCRGPGGKLTCCPKQGDRQQACCDGTCTDTQFDYFNCGSCGHRCDSEDLCKPDASGSRRTCLCRNGVCVDPYAR